MVKKVAKTKKVSSKKEDEPIQKEEKVKSLPKSKKEKKKPEKSEKVEANQENNEESIEEEEENKEIFKIPKTRVEKAQGIVDELTSPNSNTAIYVGHLPWGFEDHALKKYFEQEDVSTVVMGFPADVDEKKDIVVEIKKVYQMLLNTFPEKKIELYDERYTSKIAFYALRNFGKKVKTQKENLDKMSAAVLLESYMNSAKFRKK